MNSLAAVGIAWGDSNLLRCYCRYRNTPPTREDPDAARARRVGGCSARDPHELVLASWSRRLLSAAAVWSRSLASAVAGVSHDPAITSRWKLESGDGGARVGDGSKKDGCLDGDTHPFFFDVLVLTCA
jgi:hypothetical protein